MLLYHINGNIVRMKNSIFTRKIEVMNTKLTLSMDDVVIEKAKQYAALHNISLSKLVERYLNTLEDAAEDVAISPTVQELTGIMPPIEYEVKEAYRKHLVEKYS